MLIVGERLNSSRKPVLRALQTLDKKYLLDEASRQERAGADYIDINAAALLSLEPDRLRWAVSLLQKKVRIPLSIDTPNAEAMKAGLEIHRGRALLNSISGESERVKTFLPLIKRYNPRVIVLCLDDAGLPANAEEELRIAEKMVSLLTKEDISPEDIFIDPLVRPIGVEVKTGKLFLSALEKIKKNLPEVKTIAGISNVSFGLPQRKLLNRIFLVLALQKGLDGAILDPLDKEMRASLFFARAIMGEEKALRNYLEFFRKNRQ